tara:strand:- start:218 stop:484 length:267 start_codon:yes stop_codon:yes gene_type:complete
MKKITLNKDGTPRKRRNSKSGSPTVKLTVEEILELTNDQANSVPVSLDWVKDRLYADYLSNKSTSNDFSETQSLEDKIEYAITDFENE